MAADNYLGVLDQTDKMAERDDREKQRCNS